MVDHIAVHMTWPTALQNSACSRISLPGSPLIDGGSPDAAACPDTDQLGNPCPQDGDGLARCNIGAIETNAVAPPLIDVIFSSRFAD
jgi:hypothetical protein